MHPTDVIAPRTYPRAELELVDAYWRAANYLSVGQVRECDLTTLTSPAPATAAQGSSRTPASTAPTAWCAPASARTLHQQLSDARLSARAYTREHGEHDPAISGWTWPDRG